MTTGDVLIACEAVGIRLEVRGEHMHVEAPAGVVTPELRDALVHHKADLLALLAPVTEFVTLKGGLVSPRPAFELAIDLERRGVRQTVEADGTYAIDAAAALTDTDRTGIARWRQHLAAIVAYECPRDELPQ